MKIEVHTRMHEKPQASNQGAGMIGKASRIDPHAENLPGCPKKKTQKNQPAKAAGRARSGKCFCVIVMAMIYDKAIINRFVKWKDFLEGTQARSYDPVILKDP